MSEPLNLADIAAEGDRRKTLEALRDLLARTIATAEPSNVAALAKQLRETMTELATLRDGAEVDTLDKLQAARPASAPVPIGAARDRKRRTAGA